jgi:hypothetical protein
LTTVIVYVEGRSDRLMLEALLAPLIGLRRQSGVEIRIRETEDGDRKHSLLTKTPRKAAGILINSPNTVVAAVPDLNPLGHGAPHGSFAELEASMTRLFVDALRGKGCDDGRLHPRFRVFCFKWDIEVLLLASREQLAAHLGAHTLVATWREPVEDQDDSRPPKVVITELFREQGRRYRGHIDGPAILRAATIDTVLERCPQHFARFVAFLRGVEPTRAS